MIYFLGFVCSHLRINVGCTNVFQATIFQAGRFWYERNNGRDTELILPRAGVIRARWCVALSAEGRPIKFP